MVVQNKRIIGLLLTAGFLLLIPLIAMQFTEEVNWNWFDFLIAGLLLLSTVLVLEIALRKIKNTSYRITIGVAIVVVLLLIWAELAVGIFGTSFAGS